MGLGFHSWTVAQKAMTHSFSIGTAQAANLSVALSSQATKQHLRACIYDTSPDFFWSPRMSSLYSALQQHILRAACQSS